MKLSRKNKGILLAARKGYRVNEEGSLISPSGDILTGGSNGKGYKCFVLVIDKRDVSVLIHRLQAYQKYGELVFEDGYVVRHLDGNSSNNSWDNIEIGTQSDNMMDVPEEERIVNASNPIHDHSEIISDWKDGMTYSQIMRKYGISSKGTVSFIVNKSLSSQQII